MAKVASDEPLNTNVRAVEKPRTNYAKEFLAGLTVSFAAMSLGAAFGDQSGRGPLRGVLSAGVLALITSLVGGTVVQCSGPTAPMTAVTVKLFAYALGEKEQFSQDFPGMNPDLFMNMTMVLAGGLLALMAVCQTGKLIQYVPNVVISGFMNGIAVMVWVPQVQGLYGWGKDKVEGNAILNTALALFTTFLIFNIPKVTGRFCPSFKSFLPGTLIALILVTAFVQACGGLGIQTVKTGEPIDTFGEVTALFTDNLPTEWSGPLVLAAFPFALQLALLGFIDTLLTSRIVDSKVETMYPPEQQWRPTNKNLELIGQALGNTACAFFGGIPGAQATIRSVLILNEGAMTRMAGICAGLLTIIEIAALQRLVALIPQCVLTGVLFKVGYDCFDWVPFMTYIKTQLLRKEHPGGDVPVVPHSNMVFILATCIANSFVPLHVVVLSAVIVYFIVHKFIMEVPDLVPFNQSKPSIESKDADIVNLA